MGGDFRGRLHNPVPTALYVGDIPVLKGMLASGTTNPAYYIVNLPNCKKAFPGVPGRLLGAVVTSCCGVAGSIHGNIPVCRRWA